MSEDFNTRQWVIDSIEPALPVSWRLLPYDVSLDNIGTEPVVMLLLDSIAPHTALPDLLDVTYKLTVIEPKQDPDSRDQALDNKVIALIEAVNAAPGLVFVSAESSLYPGGYVSYIVTLSAPLNI